MLQSYPRGGWGGRCDGWEIIFHLRKPWVRWEHGKISDLCHVCPFTGIKNINGQMFFFLYKINRNMLILQIDSWEILWNWNCLKFKLFYTEREFLNNLLSYLYMHGQRRNGRKFCPEKVKYSKWEMLINILDILWRKNNNNQSNIPIWLKIVVHIWTIFTRTTIGNAPCVTLLCGGRVIFIRRRRGNIYPPPYLSMSGFARGKHAPDSRR